MLPKIHFKYIQIYSNRPLLIFFFLCCCHLVFLEDHIVVVWAAVPLVVVVSLVCLVPIVPVVLVVVPGEDMPWLDMSMVVLVVPSWWEVVSITNLRIHRGCVVGRGSLHRSGRGSSCCSSKGGEEESKELHGWRARRQCEMERGRWGFYRGGFMDFQAIWISELLACDTGQVTVRLSRGAINCKVDWW